MTPAITFFAGIALLVLLGWYFGTDNAFRKRMLGTVLTIAVTIMCLLSLQPLKQKIRLGLDLQGGTAFLIRLVGGEKQITKAMVDQAVEVIRNASTNSALASRSSRRHIPIVFSSKFPVSTRRKSRKRATSSRE